MLSKVNYHRFEWVLSWDLELNRHVELRVLVISGNNLLGRLVEDESELVLGTKFELSQFNLLDLVLHDGRTDDLLDIRPGDFENLSVASIVEFTRERGEALHEVDQSVQGHKATRTLLRQHLAVLRLEVGQVLVVVLLSFDILCNNWQVRNQGD